MNAENWMFLMFFHYKMLLKKDTMHLNAKINSYMKPWKRQKNVWYISALNLHSQILMNAPVVYTAVTSSLCVRTPLGLTAVHVNSILMETVKTASTLRAVSIVFIGLG